MQIVVLSGGKGTRISSISKGVPKGLMEVRGRPFLYWLLRSFSSESVNNVHLCLGYGAEAILLFLESTCVESLDLSITYSLEDPENLLGTAGALYNASNHLEDNFIVQYGDTLLDINYGRFLEKHLKAGVPMSMSIVHKSLSDEVPNVIQMHSAITLDAAPESMYLYRKYSPYPGSDYIDYGCLCLCKNFIIKHANSFRDLSLLQEYASSMQLCSFVEVSKPYIEIGTPESYLRAKERFF